MKSLKSALLLWIGSIISLNGYTKSFSKQINALSIAAAYQHIQLNTDIATNEGLKNTANALHMTTNLEFTSYRVTSALDIIFYKDINPMQKNVDFSLNGNLYEDESSTTGTLFSLSAGPFVRSLHNELTTSLEFGYAHMTSSERSPLSCNDCPSTPIDIKGGLFSMINLEYKTRKKAFITANIKQYFTNKGINKAYAIGAGSFF